jgi:hypothetical protein
MSKKEILEFKSAPRLERGATIVPSRWSIAIIASDDELILPHRANRADGIFRERQRLFENYVGGHMINPISNQQPSQARYKAFDCQIPVSTGAPRNFSVSLIF